MFQRSNASLRMLYVLNRSRRILATVFVLDARAPRWFRENPAWPRRRRARGRCATFPSALRHGSQNVGWTCHFLLSGWPIKHQRGQISDGRQIEPTVQRRGRGERQHRARRTTSRSLGVTKGLEASTRWLRIRFRNSASRAGSRARVLGHREHFGRVHEDVAAPGWPSRWSPHRTGRRPSARCRTGARCADRHRVAASSISIESRSASVGACVEITTVSGSSCAAVEVSIAS